MQSGSITTAQLLKILDVTRHLAEQRMVQPLLEYVVLTVFDLIPVERCFIVLFNQNDSLDIPIARTRNGEIIDHPSDQVSLSILGQVREDLTPALIHDALEDSPFTSARSVRELGLRSVLCVPFISHESAIGAIYVENRSVRNQFEEAHQLPLVLLANQVVVALENAHLYESLEATVAERTHNLSQAIKHLRTTQQQLIQSEKMASLGNLLAGVAHELRNPLNFVNNLAKLSVDLISECKGLISQQFQAQGTETVPTAIAEALTYLSRNCEEIYTNGQRANSIIAMMLLHTRGVSGHKEIVKPNALVEQALNLAYHGAIAHRHSAQSITIERYLDPTTPTIEADPLRLSQALINIIDNACYALWAYQDQHPDALLVLRIRTTYDDQHVEIHVWDNGIGIAPEVRENLFEPFVTNKPPGEGTGLGLSLAYDIIVNGHGGTITALSESARSTEFVIRLPIQYESAAPLHRQT